MNRIVPSTQDGAAAFTTTHWSMVLAAHGPTPAARAALDKLCRTYWRPIYGFVRRLGVSPEEAKDLTQGFFCSAAGTPGFECGPPGERASAFLFARITQAFPNERAQPCDGN